MFFEKNAHALLATGEVHRFLIQQLQQTEPTGDCELYPTPDGNYTLHYRKLPLHDPERPLAEVEECIQTNCTAGTDRVHLILGIGLGYLPDQVYQSSQGQMIIYEPDLPLLRFILDNVDFSEMFASKRVYLTATKADLLILIRKQLYRQYQLDVMMLRGSAYLLAKEIPALMDALQEIELDRIHDFKTGQHFHLQWLQQFFQNYPYLAQYDTVDRLAGQFTGKPALVISRGPSLDGALDAIKSLADSAVLIAVGSAIRRLWESGITPDFAVFYDANGMQEQLYGIPSEFLNKITFLVSPTTQPCCFTAPSYGKLVFLTQNNMQFTDWLDTVLQQKHYRLDGGGTVSLIAFQTALAMECNPIVLVGQDLAFPNNQVYAGGIPLQVNNEGYMTLTRSETLYAEPETLDTIKGQQGETLQTLKAYKSFIRHFEDLAIKNARNPQAVQLYNASLGGAHIEGYPLCLLADFIPKWAPWKQSHALSQKPNLSDPFLHTRANLLLGGLMNLRKSLQEAITLCNSLSHALKKDTINQLDMIEDIRSANKAFNSFMQNNPFVAYIVMFEIIEFRNQINSYTTAEALQTEGKAALLNLLNACETLFKDNALTWVSNAEQTFIEMSEKSRDCLIS